MGTNSAPLLADLFLHIYEYDLLYAYNNEIGYGESRVSFGNTSRYIDDLFSAETTKVLEITSVLSTVRNWNWRKLPRQLLLDNLIFTRNSNYLRSVPLEYSGRCGGTLGPSP